MWSSVLLEEEMQKHLLARYRHGSVSVVFDVIPQEVLDETFKNKASAFQVRVAPMFYSCVLTCGICWTHYWFQFSAHSIPPPSLKACLSASSKSVRWWATAMAWSLKDSNTAMSASVWSMAQSRWIHLRWLPVRPSPRYRFAIPKAAETARIGPFSWCKLGMYKCIYIYIYICNDIHFADTCIHVQECTHVQAQTHTHMHILLTYIDIYKYVCVFSRFEFWVLAMSCRG